MGKVNEINLVIPTIAYKTAIEQYRKDFDHQVIEGSSQLFLIPSVEEWLDYLENQKAGVNLPSGWVRSLQFLAVDSTTNQLVGMVNIRLSLNDYLLNYGGHIGYSVSPHHRQKGYGTKILQLALQEAAKHDLSSVLVTCKADNIGSIKVIKNNQGILEDQRYEPKQKVMFNRYWISTK
ncbi:GNAT family N-acetyltransferase [Mesoplasma seiffertii]|uniref:GNAT family N-acetyltransferase n=1 Tax=Mesoplasma seiffertii TaxID=28224 RepID=UPI000688F898|nr:GNAT family N-acetyltransferase [Mesoplasma seiffertii]